MKTKVIKTITILLVLAACFSCGKEEPIKLAGTHWELAGIVDVETGELRELDVYYSNCQHIDFDTDSTARGCIAANEIELHLSPQQVYVVITIKDDDFYTEDIQLFYDTIKTLISYTVTKDELKLYCNKEKNYLLYKYFELVHY